MIGFLNIFKSKDKGETKALLAALYKMMMADAVTRSEESDYFWNLCREKGLSKEETQDIIRNCSKLCECAPGEKAKQEEFLSELSNMMKIDGSIHPDESALLKQYAEMMGVDENEIPQ